MATSADRLRLVMAMRGVRAPMLARRLGIPRQTMHVWLARGLEKADAVRFVALCEFLNVRGRWLIGGRGLMQASSGNPDLRPRAILRLCKGLTPEALAIWVRVGMLLVSNLSDKAGKVRT